MAKCATYGLIGRTLGHSFSQAYFTEKFARESIDACYLNFELSDIGVLYDVIAAHPGLRGFNVTIPYKQDIIPMLDTVDTAAAAIGAVNTVRVEPDGSLSGFNTDAPGFAASLHGLLGDAAVPPRGLVLGTGGASLAVVAALRGMGCEPVCVSRTPQSGQLSYGDVTADVIKACGVIVNATPLGTWPRVDEAPALPYDALAPGHFCMDLVYNPDPTLFMRLCAARGAAVRSGLDMLHRQAEGSWRIWNNNDNNINE